VRHVTGIEPVAVPVRVELEKCTLADVRASLFLAGLGPASVLGLEPAWTCQLGFAAVSSRATAVSAPNSVRLDPLTS